MQLHHPLGKIIDTTTASGADKIGNGLFGYFPMTTPLVNIVTPTYLSETTNYNYSLDRVANPTRTKDISNKLRWENSSKAIKGNVGMKVSDTVSLYYQCPKFVPINYGCENAFSMSVIINKHGNLNPVYSGETAIFLKIGTGLVKVLVTDSFLKCEYGEHVSGFNLLATQQTSEIAKTTQIEHITITYKRISFNSSSVKIYDSSCVKIADFTIAGLFKEEVYLYTSGTYEITNMRTYFIELPLNIIQNICFMGDFKSKIFVKDSDFDFKYDWNTTKIMSAKSSIEKYPYGSCRAFAVGNENIRRPASFLANILSNIPGMRISDPEYIESMVAKKERFANKRASTDSVNYRYQIETNTSIDSDIAEPLGNINIGSSVFATPFARTDLWKIINRNAPYIMSIMHYGYFFVKENFPDEEYFKRIDIDLSGIAWGDIKTATDNKLLIVSLNSSPSNKLLGSNDTMLKTNPLYVHNMTNEAIYIHKYVYRKSDRRYVSQAGVSIPAYNSAVPVYINITENLGTPCDDDDCTSVLLVALNASSEVIYAKNLEVYTDVSALSNVKKPLCRIELPGGDRRSNLNYIDGSLNYILEGTPTFFADTPTSRHYEFRQGDSSFVEDGVTGGILFQGMMLDNEFPKYQKSLTKIEQIKHSGKCMASSIVELNFGIYNDIKYLFSPYCKLKSADNNNIYTLSTEQWTGTEESNLVENSLIPKNVSFTISNTESLKTRIVADMLNTTNDILIQYSPGNLIPNLGNYKFIKIGNDRYLYQSSIHGYRILQLSQQAGGFLFVGSNTIYEPIPQSSLYPTQNEPSEIILYKGDLADNNVVIIGDISGYFTRRTISTPGASMDEIEIKVNGLYEICQYSIDIEQYLNHDVNGKIMKLPHIYFLPKEESYDYFETKDDCVLTAKIKGSSKVKNSLFHIWNQYYSPLPSDTVVQLYPSYNFDEQPTAEIVNRVYGVNRFIRRASTGTSGPTYGYGVNTDDSPIGPFNDFAWRLETTVSGLSTTISQSSKYITSGKTDSFIFELEHLKSTNRSTTPFDIIGFCNNFSTTGDAAILRVRNPITKESYKYDDLYFESPEIGYANDNIKEIIDFLNLTYVYKNDSMLPSIKFCDTSISTPIISSEVYMPFESENRIILAGNGLYGTPIKAPDGSSIVLYSTGYVYTYFITIKKSIISNEIFLQDDETDNLYKTSDIGVIALKNGADIYVFQKNDASYDMKPLISTNGTYKAFDIYGFKKDHSFISPFQIERDGIVNIEESKIVLKSELLTKYPSLYANGISLFENSVRFANNTYLPLSDVFLRISQSKEYSYSIFTNSKKKSWISKIGVNSGLTSGILMIEPEINSDRQVTMLILTGSAKKISDDTTTSQFYGGTLPISSLYDSFILGYEKSADRSQMNIDMVTFSSIEDMRVVMDGVHSFSLEKESNLITPISNGITYNDVYSYSVKTHEYTQPIENGFLLKDVVDNTTSFSFKNKRHLDQITVRISRTPQTVIPGIKTNNVIRSSVYPNDKVSIERSDLEYSIYNNSDDGNILSLDSKTLAYDSATAKFKLKDTLDSNYKYTIATPPDAPSLKERNFIYEETITKTEQRDIIVYGLTPGEELDEDENYVNKYSLSLQCEVLPYIKREINIRDRISYSTSDEFDAQWYAETTSSYLAIAPDIKPLVNGEKPPRYPETISSSGIESKTPQNAIKSIKIKDVLATSTYFGNNITINEVSIPYNDVEIFKIPSADAVMYYDFYGKSYKKYDKLNLMKTCTISENKTNQKIGIQSDLIEIDKILSCSSSSYDGRRMKEISFLIKYDNLNLLGSSSDEFNISLGVLNLFDESILDKTYDGWKHISIRFDDFNYTIFEYDAGIYSEIKPASPHSFAEMLLYRKLSILNTRWSICDLEIKNEISDSAESSLNRLHYENSIQVVDGKYQIPNGKYLYSESYIPASKHEIDLDFTNGTIIPPDFLYGKFQHVYGRASKQELILFDEVYSYRNVPDNNKLITQNEADISEYPINISFDLFVQKLGVTELNNPVIFVDKISEGVWSYKKPPKDSSELLYVACLVSDNTYDTLEMESFMEYDSYSYNRNLPAYKYLYTNQKAILGRQIVMVDSIEGTFEYEDREYRVVKVSPIDKQRFFPLHIEGEWIRNVYDFSSITESYEFNDNMVDAESDIYKPSRASGSVTLKDDIYKFNKFGNRVGKYSVDKGCAVYLFEGHIDNPILQSTLFIDTIVTNTKEESIQISLKNKVDLIYDKKIINYKTFENVGIKEIIKQALFPYFYVLDDMIRCSAISLYSDSLPPNIKTINFSSFNTIGEIFDSICSCGFNIWIDELERIIIDTDAFSKLIYEDKKVEYENGYNSAFKDGIRDANILFIDNVNDLTDDIIISEKDGLIVNKIELAHENLVPMYERSEYVKEDKIYPINNIGLDIATSDTLSGSIVYFDKTQLIKPSLLAAYKTIADFNKLKMKTGVMCVVRRGDYELQYKFIQAKKESV